MNKGILFAIVVGVVIPALVGAVYYTWPDRPPAAPEFDWGVRGNGVLNAIQPIEEFDAERGTFSYYTGGRSGDRGPLTAPPTHAAIPVEIDVHFMPEDARFSHARRVDWREGRPFVLALFSRDRLSRDGGPRAPSRAGPPLAAAEPARL